MSTTALTPTEADPSFGNRIAFSGNTAIIGAQQSFYVFARKNGAWTQQGDAIERKISASLPVSVAVSGQYALIGEAADPGKDGLAYIVSDACTIDSDCSATAFCAAGTCRARCRHDSECPAGSFCPADGLCREQLVAGAVCDDGGCKESGCQICATGHCVDDRCCESLCDGSCEACAAAVTGGADGKCLPIPADQDPDSECAEDAEYPASCRADGACNGKGACRQFAKTGTTCGDTVCSGSSVTGSVCDGPERVSSIRYRARLTPVCRMPAAPPVGGHRDPRADGEERQAGVSAVHRSPAERDLDPTV